MKKKRETLCLRYDATSNTINHMEADDSSVSLDIGHKEAQVSLSSEKDPPIPPPSRQGLSRRDILRGGLIGGVAGVVFKLLAGCGSEDIETDPTHFPLQRPDIKGVPGKTGVIFAEMRNRDYFGESTDDPHVHIGYRDMHGRGFKNFPDTFIGVPGANNPVIALGEDGRAAVVFMSRVALSGGRETLNVHFREFLVNGQQAHPNEGSLIVNNADLGSDRGESNIAAASIAWQKGLDRWLVAWSDNEGTVRINVLDHDGNKGWPEDIITIQGNSENISKHDVPSILVHEHLSVITMGSQAVVLDNTTHYIHNFSLHTEVIEGAVSVSFNAEKKSFCFVFSDNQGIHMKELNFAGENSVMKAKNAEEKESQLVVKNVEGNVSHSPSAIALPDGTILITWHQEGNEGNDVYMRKIYPTGELSTIEQISHSGEAFNPVITLTAEEIAPAKDGEVIKPVPVVAYFDSNGGLGKIVQQPLGSLVL